MEIFLPKKRHSFFSFKKNILIISILIIFLIFFIVYYLSIIKKISVKDGLSTTTNEKIIGAFNQIELNNNQFSLPKSFKISQPFFTGEILIERKYLTQEIVLIPVAKDPIGVICESEADTKICFWFDENNLIFKEAPAPSGKKIFIINEKGIGNHSLGEKLMPNHLFENLIKIFNYPNIISIISNTFELNIKKEELLTTNNEDIITKLSLRFDPTNNLKALEKGQIEAKEYIDLRVENRIYYK